MREKESQSTDLYSLVLHRVLLEGLLCPAGQLLLELLPVLASQGFPAGRSHLEYQCLAALQHPGALEDRWDPESLGGLVLLAALLDRSVLAGLANRSSLASLAFLLGLVILLGQPLPVAP